MNVLEVKQLQIMRDQRVIIDNLSFELPEGHRLFLQGDIGCGKSTLLHCLLGFIPYQHGEISWFDNTCRQEKDFVPLRGKVGICFQHAGDQLFGPTVLDDVAFGPLNQGLNRDEAYQIALQQLERLNIVGLKDRSVNTLSGGEQNFTALAGVLAMQPKVLLLDEPLGALDLKLRKEMQYELKRIQQEVGITFIYVTHDQEEALTMSDKIVIMKGGEIQQVGTPQEIYNEPVNKYVANFIGESNVISGIMVEDYKVKFDDQIFDCVDFGFKPNEKVDVVLRPEDIDIVPLEQGKITGEVLSVLFKGVWNEAMVETVPGTTVKVNMNVIKNHDVESEYSDERISANDFYVDIEEVASLDDNDLIARADAQAWKESDDSYISISKIEHNLKEELGEYTVTFQTSSGLSVSRKIIVVDQKYVKNEKANEAVSAFNFFKTVDEIKESVALDTDLKTWANAIGWKLSNEDEAVDIYVDYDFDPENIKEGIYQVTFSTEGRELKVHTTDYVEEGQEVGLTFEVEDIHVMEKMGF